MKTGSQPFTKLAALFAAIAVGLLLWRWISGVPAFSVPVEAVLLALAYGCVCLEFKTHTGRTQILMVLVVGSLLGLLIDLHLGRFPLATVAVLLSSVAMVVRQAFMQRFTYVKYLWFEPLLIAASISFYMGNVINAPFTWDLWLLPLLPIAAASVLVAGYVQDGVILKRSTRFGYRIQVGQPAPRIALPDQDGVLVELTSYKDLHPVLLIFVRGDWCPGCHMMLRTYERSREIFLRKGVHVLAIGPDSIDVNKDMVERLGVGYKLLSDRGQQVSRQFGVLYNNPLLEKGLEYAQGIPLPASFLVDKAGIIRYVSRPDRVGEFLNPELIFGVLESMPDSAVEPWAQRRA